MVFGVSIPCATSVKIRGKLLKGILCLSTSITVLTVTPISRSLSSDRTLKSSVKSAAQKRRKSRCHALAWAGLQAVPHHLQVRAVPAAAAVLPHPAQGASSSTVI